MLWGVAWWYGGGALEVSRAVPERLEGNAILAFAIASVACALLLRRLLRWPRLAWFGVALLPLMAVVALADWDVMRTTLPEYGWLVWPVAWATHWRVLLAADALRAGEGVPATGGRVAAFLRFAHAASAIALVAWVAWEGERMGGALFSRRYRVDGLRGGVAGHRLPRLDRARRPRRRMAVGATTATPMR